MSIELIKSIELVPKRNAFKAPSYNNVGLKKWVDFGNVREHFNYSEHLRLRRFISFLTELMTNCDVFSSSFLASSISAITSCGKRISTRFDLLLCLPVAIFYKLSSCLYRQYITKKNNKKGLTCRDTINYIVVTPFNCIGAKITIAHRGANSLSYLTTITLTEVMIMANRYDSAHLRARQSKLYKFYDLSTAQVIQTTATTERQARKNLGKQSLIFIARIRITPIIERARTWGGYNHD